MPQRILVQALNKVGVVRGPGLNPYEGQFFEKLPKFDFLPVGITTYDNISNLSEIHFPVRIGHNFNTLTHGVFRRLLYVATKATKYEFSSYSLQIWNLKKLTSDLDILHSADIWFPFTYEAVKTKIPTIVTEWETIPFNAEVPPFAKMKKYNREHVKHFVAVTEKAKKALVTEGVSPDRISVIPAGIDCEKFKPAPKNEDIAKQFGFLKDTLTILYVARLVPEKGIFDLLNAFSMLKKNFRNVFLLVVGSGTQQIKEQIAEIILDLKIGSQVKFIGGIKYSFMPNIHNLAEIFCLPSVATKVWEEQFGYALVEAMACGKPVVSTSTGSIPEIVKDGATGILVKQNDPDALRDALEELVLDAKKRKTLGMNGREWVLQRFEANKIAKQLADIYGKFI
jgi:glycosyltransferase involved in cell wall biosynthesis